VTRTLWLLLPAYDEERNLPPLLTDVQQTWRTWGAPAPTLRVVVVDDGSRDRTAEAAASVYGLPVEVIRHGRNRGLGVAMRTGIEHVLAHAGPDDVLVVMDADHTHPPDSIPFLLGRADDGADIVICSRYAPGARVHGLSATRRALSRAASLLMQAMFPGAKDYTCGYRLYRVSLLRWGRERYGRHFLNQPGFAVMVDLLLKLRRRARRIDEVPLTLRYDRKRGASKMKILRTAGTTLRLMARRFRGDPTGP
jgi:dolichol-phosphate mannosyltransferase